MFTAAALILAYLLVGMLLDKLVTWSRARKAKTVSKLGTVVLWFLWPQVLFVMIRARRKARV